MSSYPESVENLIEEFGKLPGIGDRTAERLALHLLLVPKEEALGLAEAIIYLKEKTKQCSICHNVSDIDPCHICSDPQRDRSVICVVEDSRDVTAIEKSSSYRGLYHVLLGRYSPLDDMDEDDLTIDTLVGRLKSGEVKELIIATNPNLAGDATATLVGERVKDSGVTVTRIARGMPQGSQIEHVSGAILSDALKGRRNLENS